MGNALVTAYPFGLVPTPLRKVKPESDHQLPLHHIHTTHTKCLSRNGLLTASFEVDLPTTKSVNHLVVLRKETCIIHADRVSAPDQDLLVQDSNSLHFLSQELHHPAQLLRPCHRQSEEFYELSASLLYLRQDAMPRTKVIETAFLGFGLHQSP